VIPSSSKLVRRVGAAIGLALGSFLPATHAAPQELWYGQPATKWTEALPIGNGRLGAMVFGGVADERIQFNEDTLWTGRPHDYDRADAVQPLPALRELVADKKITAANQLVKERFLGDPVRQKAYQPFGDLRLHVGGANYVTDYRRELDLDSAVAAVTYRAGGVTYRREVFASYPDHVIVVRLSADQPGHVDVTLRIDSPHPTAHARVVAPDTLELSGAVQPDGLRFAAHVRGLVAGGKIAADERGLTVEHADAVTFLLTAATSFKTYQDISADPVERCTTAMRALDGREFAALRTAHVADYRRLFGRVALDLGSATTDQPTDQRLNDVRAHGLDADPALVALYFQYGRYLLIASSRPGGQPANLQGIWNDQLDPPWESKWTTNINVEMNYWPAELTNLRECHEPLFDLIDDLVVTGHRTAHDYYGCDGWVLHHNTDLWRGTAPVNGIDGVWPTGGAWLCDHLWEHYRFTGDRDFLAHRAYPAMKAASEFFAGFLINDPKTGWLVTNPSYSPEHGTLTVAPTMDNQLIRALLEHTIAAAKILGVDSAFAEKLAGIQAKLPPNQIGRNGQLQEWLDDIDKPNDAHRHMSPLWALYPGTDITPADPKVFAATKQLLTWRGDGSTGWSYAWRIGLWARAGDGEAAYRQLNGLLQRKTLPNLFDLCGPFQIDGNFGGTAGIAELLLQSHQLTPDPNPAPVIELLPALPHEWSQGSITGLRARGAFEIDLAWRDGTLTTATVRSSLGGRCVLRYRDREITLQAESGHSYAFDAQLRRTN
jgi:alpha-L-fucosidase 2